MLSLNQNKRQVGLINDDGESLSHKEIFDKYQN